MKSIEAPPGGVIDGSDTEEPDTEQPLSTKNLPEISGYNDANFRTGESFPPINYSMKEILSVNIFINYRI